MNKFRAIQLSLASVALLLVVAAAAGCNKSAEETPSSARIKPLPAAEIERAQKACATYAERICACVESTPELAKRCELAKASPGALQLNLDLLASDGLKLGEQKAVKVEARKIAAACFQADSKLDVATCPRDTP